MMYIICLSKNRPHVRHKPECRNDGFCIYLGYLFHEYVLSPNKKHIYAYLSAFDSIRHVQFVEMVQKLKYDATEEEDPVAECLYYACSLDLALSTGKSKIHAYIAQIK